MITHAEPRRGEIWMVDFNPTIGAEIQKIRPAIVISSNALGRLPLKVVVPITGWRQELAGNSWHLELQPTVTNGLAKRSAVDALQVRSVSRARFQRRLGRVTERELEAAVKALAIVGELA